MLRTKVGLIAGGAAGLLVGYVAGRLVSGAIGGSMFGIAGALVGTFAGWITTLVWPGARDGADQEADYDDKPLRTG